MNNQQPARARVSQSRSGPPPLISPISRASSSSNVASTSATRDSHALSENVRGLSTNRCYYKVAGDDDDDDDDDDELYIEADDDSEDLDNDEQDEVEFEQETEEFSEDEEIPEDEETEYIIGGDESLLNVHEVSWNTFEDNSNFEDPRGADAPRAPTLNWSAVGKRQNDIHGALDYFLAFFPGGQYLDDIIHYTNQSLTRSGRRKTDIEEFFQVLCIIIGFSSHVGLTRKELFGEYIIGNTKFGNIAAVPDFSKIMSENRFSTIVSNLRFSDQNISASHSWKCFRKNGRLLISRGWNEMSSMIEGMKHARKIFVSPSSHLTVDEGMIKWKGKANTSPEGLPHQQKVMQKPERIGAEVLMLVDAATKILLNMEFVNSREFSIDSEPRDFDEYNKKSTAAVQRLCDPWKHSNRTVYGDSAFASVLTAVRLHREQGLYFMGPVKTATRHFPKKYFKSYNFPLQPQRGHSTCAHAMVDGTKLLTVAWKGYKLKTFVSSCGTNQLGEPHQRLEYLPVSQIPPDGISTPSQRVLVQVPRDSISAEYFKYSNAVDCHNRTRQGTIALERRFATRRWMIRVFTSLLGMCITDAYNAHKYFNNGNENMSTFLVKLQMELVSFGSPTSSGSFGSPTSSGAERDAVHKLRGLTGFNQSLPEELRWKDANPKKRCNDCLKRKRIGIESSVASPSDSRVKLGSMYCLLCTERNANGRPMSRQFAHALCTLCQANHVALFGAISRD